MKMDAGAFQPTMLFVVFVVLSEFLSQAFSQTLSPQNIQTFYPFPPAPSPVIFPPDLPPPPVRGPSPSVRAAVGRAILGTAATTLFVSGLVFFLILWFTRRRKGDNNKVVGGGGGGGGTNGGVVLNQNGGFIRVNGNLKGVIVAENGMDVLYWRNVEGSGGGDRISFKKQIYRSVKENGGGGGERRPSLPPPPPQEIPLLRGQSSTSQSPIWAEIAQKPRAISIEMQETLDSAREANSPPPPPPPPPPPTKPLPSGGAVPKGKTVAYPPPPAPPPYKNPPPPIAASALPFTSKPPPPPAADAGKRSSSHGESSSSLKLKPLHWDKVNPDSDHSMVWDKIDKGSFKFDGDLMEALFGYVATNRKSPRSNNNGGSSSTPRDEKPSQIFILDPRKSQNTAIVLKSLDVSRKEIIDALIDGQGLTSDTIEKLAKVAPTPAEASQIVAFDGDVSRLADAESFLYHLLKSVPSAFVRFKAMLFRTTYDSEVSHVRECLTSLESACKEMRTRGLFLKLLEAVLKAGNRLNAGTARGNAQAFNLTALRKLSDVKSSDGKTTLLQFVVQEVVRAEGKRCVLNRNRSSISTSDRPPEQNDDSEREYMILGLPIIGGLSAEFSNVKKAAALDHAALVSTVRNLDSQLREMQKIVAQCRD
ncbi:hypothetical protein M569_14071, partial [Genlisea aurea]